MSKSQDRRVAVQREADPIARLRAMAEALPPGPHEVTSYPYLGDVPEEVTAWVPSLATVEDVDGDMMSQPTAETVAALVTLAPELLAVVEAAERAREAATMATPRCKRACGGDCYDCYCAAEDARARSEAERALDAALDALRARAAEVLR